MFSDYLSKIDQASAKTLLLIAAGLVVVCQLVAMVMVANGQVEKAQLREASHANARAATAWCIQSSSGAALRDCDSSTSSTPVTSKPSDAGFGIPTPQAISLVSFNNRY